MSCGLVSKRSTDSVDDAPAYWADFICDRIQEGTQVCCCSESQNYSHHFLLLVQKAAAARWV